MTRGKSQCDGHPKAAPKRPPVPEQEVFLAIQRAADVLLRDVEELLKPCGLSPTQYNVLRILRGAGEAGLACRDVSARMITRDPDVTRLLDRLEARQLIRRHRSTEDRRMVLAEITPAGRELLKRLDEPIIAMHRRQLGHLGAGKLRKLAELLEAARSRRE